MTRILISGGGTGGGVYPALAVAAALRDLTPRPPLQHGEGEPVKMLWIGGGKEPERDLVTREGIPFETVASAPLAGVGWRVVLAPFKIGWGMLKALALVRRFKPDVLMITGGWVTIPPALACWLMHVPILIYCPDIEPGGTIRVLRRIAARVGIVSPQAAQYYRPDQVVEAGYPLRGELLQAAGYDLSGKEQDLAEKARSSARRAAFETFALSGEDPVLLVFGGSTGARSINRAVTDHLEEILGRWQVIHITGRLDAGWVREAASKLPAKLAGLYHCCDYLDSNQMALALAVADLALARAGASALGEFPLFGLPAILVPYPYAWRTQKVNADWLASQGAAIRLDDDRLGGELVPLLAQLREDQQERDRMAGAAASLRRPAAGATLANALVALADRGGS